MTLNLPENPSLEHLKRQAKRLHKALLANDAAALNLVREFHPRRPSSEFQLTDAQLTLARQYGFPSWPALREYVALRDPAILNQAFETVKDGWIDVKDLPGDPAKLRRMLREFPGLVHVRMRNRGYTLLHYAAYRNHVEIATILLNAGANVHALSTGGATPLAVALIYPAPDVARLLLERGATIDNLRMAAGLGEMELVRGYFTEDGSLKPEAGQNREDLSLAHDFSPRPVPTDPAGILSEALMYAAQNGQLAAAEFLLERGAEINRIAFIGTPLHASALYNQRASVEFLLEHGADPNALDDEYHGIPAGWADYFGNTELAAFLRSKGGK